MTDIDDTIAVSMERRFQIDFTKIPHKTTEPNIGLFILIFMHYLFPNMITILNKTQCFEHLKKYTEGLFTTRYRNTLWPLSFMAYQSCTEIFKVTRFLSDTTERDGKVYVKVKT